MRVARVSLFALLLGCLHSSAIESESWLWVTDPGASFCAPAGPAQC
jgi:hypothetical protein